MKTTILGLILILVGAIAGALILLSEEGASRQGVKVADVLSGKVQPSERVAMQIQVLKLGRSFKPMTFHAADIPPEGQPVNMNARTIQVRYDGDDKIPVEDYSHVAVEGRWDASAGVFRADKLSTKCPTRYENNEVPKPVMSPAASTP